MIQRYVNNDYQSRTYRTLDGSEVPRKKADEGNLEGASLGIPHQEPFMFPLNGETRVRLFSDRQTPRTLWYFIHDGARKGRGYFVGYDRQSRLRAGFIGRDGFRPDPPPVEQWFLMDGVKLASRTALSPGDRSSNAWYDDSIDEESLGEFPVRGEFPEWEVVMISGDHVLDVNLRKRSVAPLMESVDLLAVGTLTTASKSKAAEEDSPRVHSHRHLAVRTTDRLLVFDAPGKKRAAFVIPDELRNEGVTLYEIEPGKALVNVSRMLPDRRSLDELLWIDAAGNVLRREKVPLNQGRRPSEESQEWMGAIVVPEPIILALGAMLAPLEELRNGYAPNYPTAVLHFLAKFWPVLLVVTLLSAALAVYCLRRHARYCQSYGAAWFVFVLLAGLPGLVGYLFHRRWPVLEKCPTCGQSVPRDRDACAKCGTAFPTPAPKGTEVFA